MRKLFTLFLALAAMTNVFASVQIGSLYYTLNDAEETAYVDEDPASILPYKSLTSVIIPTTVTYNSKTYKVTAIGNNAFNGATNITSLVVSDNVTIIGNAAFNGCIKLASVILGQGIETIGTAAFTGCSKLTNVTLMCDKIFKKTYKSDANIGTIFGEQVTDYTIGDGVKTIGSYAFGGCTNIKNITISNSVTSVYDYAFNGCSGLTQVSLPNSVTYVGYFVFANCSNLTAPVYNEHVYAYMPKSICPESVTIPEGITLIASGAFNGRNVLKSVTLPESLEEIGWAAFLGCTNLTTINFPNNIRRMDSDAFRGTGISTPLYNDYIYAYMPPSLLVSSVSIPEGIQEIARTAFYMCSELQSVEIPHSVTKIGGYAFKCSGVKYVSIGKNVSSIGSDAFFGCNHLEEIYNYATTPLIINANVFDGNADYPAVDKTTCKLYVPVESVDAYKAADVWKDFTNIIGIKDPQGINTPSLQGRSGEASKFIRDGQLLIEKDGKTYTATGVEIK